MDAIELRIGNYLERYGKIVKIVEIGIKHKNDTNYYLRCEGDNSGYWIDQFKPIQLTEEILLKCGFVRNSLNIYKKGVLISNEFEVFLGNIVVKLKHLHQLQNLYYMLNNKELEINI